MPPRLHLLLLLLLAASAFLPPAASQLEYRAAPPPPHPHAHPLKAGNSSAGGGSSSGSSTVLTTALVSAASLLIVLLLYLCVAIAVRRFRKPRPGGHEEGRDGIPSQAQSSRASAFLRRHGLHHNRPAFTYEQLRAATAGFDAGRKLGDGGFGTVYLGYLPPAGRPAAVKRLHVPPSPGPAFPSAAAAITKSFCSEAALPCNFVGQTIKLYSRISSS